jgi:hypothetical protein
VSAWRSAWPALEAPDAAPPRFLRLIAWFAEECQRDLALFQPPEAAVGRKLEKALADVAGLASGADEPGDLQPALVAAGAALAALAAALGTCFGGYRPPRNLRVRGANVSEFDEKWDRVKVQLEGTLAEELASLEAAEVLVNLLRCGATRLDRDEQQVRIDPEADPLACDTKARLRKRRQDADAEGFAFEYEPPREHLSHGEIVFYLDREVRLNRDPDGDCAASISVQGKGHGAAQPRERSR